MFSARIHVLPFALGAFACAGPSCLWSTPAAAAIAVSVDTNADMRLFSQLIFGVTDGDDARVAAIGYPLRRWGGIASSRYNWQVDVHNAVSDGFFENVPGASDRTQVPPLNNSADTFIGAARGYGADVLLTIPTIGWTPRADSPLIHPYFFGFSTAKYGPQDATDPNEPLAGNGLHNGVNITGNDPHDTSTAVTPVFQQGWIAHLLATFGGAAAGGVRYYALDNETMLWNSTNRDVHPEATTYGEAWNTGYAYAAAIKQQDPAAKVTGPVTWGYCDLFSSEADACLSNGSDRAAHGGTPFVAWYLQQVCTHPLAGGARAVDVLDLHYFPQGTHVAFSDDDTPPTAALRLRSLKELYDPTWVSESWIGNYGDNDANHYDKPDLIPRVRGWINQYCPGTQLAISEYNWGKDGTVSGAVAQAELFGIFAREGVDMATRLVAPNANTMVERAFQLFLDYDGAGARVQGASVRAVSANVDQVGAYAFALGGRTVVLLTNKTTTAQDVALTFARVPGLTWALYGFDGGNPVHQISSGAVSGTALTLAALPAMSANLLVVDAGDVIFQNGFD